MKFLLPFTLSLASLLLRAAEPDIPQGHPLSAPPATILGISRATDKRSLTIQYELAGRTNQLQVVLTNGIADFHFCSYMMDRGIALALTDLNGEIYWAAVYFARRPGPVYPRLLPTPNGHQLLGIGNPYGDNIVITGLKRFHDPEVRASGWMYFNGCPPMGDIFSRIPTNKVQVSGFEHLVDFEVPFKKSESDK